MKNIILSIFISVLCFGTQIQAQNIYCDSLSVSNVSITGSMLNITVYNESQHFFAYPYFTINLDNNSYIQLNDSVTVLSFLSAVGDANNGFTTAVYIGNIISDSLVPLNTQFTGSIRITDPNDSTFNCVYPFTFVYGTMITALQSNHIQNQIHVFPNPANEVLNINFNFDMVNDDYVLTDQIGSVVASGNFNSKLNTIEIDRLTSGVYYLKINSNVPFNSKIIILKN